MKNERIQIVYKRVDELREYENNPRNNDNAVEAVAASIQLAGFKVPMVIDVDGVIVAGHTRLKAAKRLGMTEVPCIIADDLTEEQIRAFRLADNKVSELAGWNFDKLDDEMEILEEMGMDMSVFGFSDEGDSDILEAINDNEEDRTKSNEFKMTFGKHTCILTEDEYEDLLNRYDDYISENGVSFGFVRWLLNG